MERLYNPTLMSEDEIKKTFVGRQPIIDDLMSIIERQPEGAGVQHAVIVAPRGMGKTTLLLLTGYAVKDRGLAPPWQVVHFPEESYNIYDLADLWLTVLETISIDTHDKELQIRSNKLKTEFPKSQDLQEAALAFIKDWCRQHNRRLLLLIDNFDMILSVFNDEQENASLRHALMNDGTMMIVGGATSFFKEARDYNQPLYNFFKIYHLDKLKLDDIQNLLRQRASLDGDGNFEEALKTNASRIRTLEYFTFGNPRLVLMLYRIITQSEVLEVRRGLEKLLDEVTPYYKAKTENLPPQQRKILDHIARVTSQTNEGQTPKEIAEAVRMTPNLVSSQLKRLLDDGYVRVANLRGRSTYYTLSEPLYSIWYQMRFGRDARQRMQWLVTFLKGFYSLEELGTESEKLISRFQEYVLQGLAREAYSVLEHQRYIADAIPDTRLRTLVMEKAIQGYITLKNTEIETLHKTVSLPPDIMADLDPTYFSYRTLIDLVEDKYVEVTDTYTALVIAEAAKREEQYEEALKYNQIALDIEPHNSIAWDMRRSIFVLIGRFEEAVTCSKQFLRINPRNEHIWFLLGVTLAVLGKYEEAIDCYDHSIDINPSDYQYWQYKGNSFALLDKHEEAIKSFEKSIELNPNNYTDLWDYYGIALSHLERREEAIRILDHSISIRPDNFHMWIWRGINLMLTRIKDGLESFYECLRLIPDHEKSSFTYVSVNLYIFDLELLINGPSKATPYWYAALEAGQMSEDWYSAAFPILSSVAERGHFKLVRKLISDSELDETFFPLARALDYVITGNEAFIEKLSPEIRNIVDEIVVKLRNTNKQSP